MKVLVLSRRGIAKAFTGDSTQMRQTIRYLRPLVEKITQVFVDNDGCLYDENDSPLGDKLSSLCSQHDVAHQLPRLNFRAHKAIQQHLSKIPTVVSTVYWHDIARVIIAWRNSSGFKNKLLSTMRSSRAGSKRLQDYRVGCDVILPNSWAEGENVRKHFRLASHVESMPVPNAIEVPEFDVEKLPKPEFIAFDEYVVCPAVFASRKNQIALIRALKHENIPVVFMGDSLEDAHDFWEMCQREATEKMLFIPHIDNKSKEYWSVLRHARCACLPADCETPGIALLEAAYAGTRPIVPRYGGTQEYYGFCAEYLDPLSVTNIRRAVQRAWMRGRLGDDERHSFERFTWQWCADLTLEAYHLALRVHHRP